MRTLPLFTIGVYLAVFVALLDQGSKWWVLKDLLRDVTFLRVNDLFNLRLSWNAGVTFGLFAEAAPFMPVVLIVGTLLIMVFLLRWLTKIDTVYGAVGIGFVLGGAVGNVIDRFRYGAVVDFLDFHLGAYHWYTFNLADSFIVMGVGLLFLENALAYHKEGKGKDNQ